METIRHRCPTPEILLFERLLALRLRRKRRLERGGFLAPRLEAHVSGTLSSKGPKEKKSQGHNKHSVLTEA